MNSIEHSMPIKNDMYNAFPSIVRAKNGNLVMVFRQADNSLKKYGAVSHVDPSSCVALCTSSDEGATWSEVRIIHDDEYGSQDPCITCLNDGTLLCTFFQWNVVPIEEKAVLGEAFEHYGRTVFDRWAAVHIGTVCIRSTDHGETWDGPYPMTPTGFEGPAALRGNVVELASGTLLSPLYAAKHFGDTATCLILASEDGGYSWESRGEIPADPSLHFLEPFLYQAPLGRLDILMRTQKDFRKMDFNATYLPLYRAFSTDGGTTWSTPVSTNLFCPNPVHVLSLDSDRVLLTYGQRKKPIGIEAVITDAETLDLEHPTIEVVRPADSGDLGYTSAVRLKDGSVLVVYYMTDEEDAACIGATKIGVAR